MELATVLTYVVIAGLAVASTLLFLLMTKIPVVVTIGSGLLSAALTLGYARLEAGHADPFAPIAFVTTMFYAIVVSFVTLWIGRTLRRPFFVK
jgi:hypothetical protein